jgi:hypothetical protein
MANKQLLLSDATTATTLMALVVDAFGVAGLEFEREILEEALNSLAGDEVPEINADKIISLFTSITTPRFWDDFYFFNATANCIGGRDDVFIPDVFTPALPEEMAWATIEVAINDPGDPPGDRFHPDVRTFIGVLLNRYGFSIRPDSLSFAIIPEFLKNDPFVEDPDLFQEVQYIQSNNAGDVDRYVGNRLTQLEREMEVLELKNGSTEDLLEILKQG